MIMNLLLLPCTRILRQALALFERYERRIAVDPEFLCYELAIGCGHIYVRDSDGTLATVQCIRYRLQNGI